MHPPTTPPFTLGDRTRCRASTLGRREYGYTELLGRAGTVVEVRWHTEATGRAYWSIRVRYDHLSPSSTLGNDVLHRAGELRALEE